MVVISSGLFFFLNPFSYIDFLNGPFHQIRSFSVTHLWHSPECLVLFFINDNKGKRENSKHRSLNNSRNILGVIGLSTGSMSSLFEFSTFGFLPFE